MLREEAEPLTFCSEPHKAILSNSTSLVALHEYKGKENRNRKVMQIHTCPFELLFKKKKKKKEKKNPNGLKIKL
jgi:hypothetical protein